MKHNMKLGKYLMEKRVEAGLTQRGLGKKLGLTSGQFVCNYEQGQAPVPLDQIKIMIKILGLDPFHVIDLIQEERLSYLRESLLGKPRKIASR